MTLLHTARRATRSSALNSGRPGVFALRLLAAGLAMAAATVPFRAHAQVSDSDLKAIIGFSGAKPEPGCALAIYRQGRLERFVSDAVADLSTGAPIDADTQFYAASISKQFTAIAVVQLHLAGKLDLDGDLRTWIPELPRYRAKVTPRMMLQHASGIQDSLSLVSMVHGPGKSGSTSREETLALVVAQTDTNFVPGTSVYYSNGAYLLLAELIQRVSGQRYAAYLKTHVLDPMRMRDSYMIDCELASYRKRANGYAKRDDGWVVRNTFPRYGGSGGLMVTLNDLARYEYDIEVGKRVWTPELRRIMEAPGMLTDGHPTATMDRKGSLIYASGLMVGERNGRHVVEHGGGADAFRHMYTRLPAHNLGVATFCNIGEDRAMDKNMAIIELLLGPADNGQAGSPALMTGVYRSTTLPVRYVVNQTPTDTLVLTAFADGRERPSFQSTLQKVEEGVYRSAGHIVRRATDDPDVLMIGTPRASALRAKRIDR